MYYFKSVLLLLVALTLSIQSQGQRAVRATVSGFIKELGSGETIPGANVYVPGTTTGTTSNNYGFYSLSLPIGKVDVTYSYVGYKPQTVRLDIQKDTVVDITLEAIIDIKSVVVEGQTNHESSRSARMGSIVVPKKAMLNVPMIFGERDVLKVVQLMPGVQKGREGTSGIYVRGGSPDQNLIILDEAPVYNVHHVLGFFSLFNGTAIKSLELVKGGFPARYGGRLSSVVEMVMEEGNMREYHGSASIGLIATSGMLQGPIVKDKVSFVLTGRRTYVDALVRPFFRKRETGVPIAYFFDLTGKINWVINKKNRIYLSSYLGRDRFGYKLEDDGSSKIMIGLGWGNITGTIRWNSIISPEIFSNLTAIYSRYNFNVTADIIDNHDKYYQHLGSNIQNVGLKWDLSWNVHPDHSLRMGYHIVGYEFIPSIIVQNISAENINERRIRRVYTMENSVYAEDNWRLWDWGRANVGLRLSLYNAHQYTKFSLEPRVSMAFYLTRDLSLKAAFSMMSQNLHLLTGNGFSMPTDLWVPATKRLPSQNSWLVSLGGVYDIPIINSYISLEAYYKRYNGNISYKEGASYFEASVQEHYGRAPYESLVVSGQGESYGLEFMFQRKIGELTGWIAYTLAFTKHQFPDLNFGKPFWATYDRRHDLSLVLMYQFNKRWSMSGTFVFGSGQPMTLPQSQFDMFQPITKDRMKEWIPAGVSGLVDYGEINRIRMEHYHRLDLGVQYKKQFKRVELLISLDIYNTYSHYNPFFYIIKKDSELKEKPDRIIYRSSLYKVAVFPIIPTFTFTLNF